LTPIEDTDDVWSDKISNVDEVVSRQCKRMSSLFKDTYPDGTVKYTDNNYYYAVDINDFFNKYNFSLIRDIIYKILPITMPYYPENPIIVYCEDFLTDMEDDHFNTFGIFYAIKPNFKKVDINRFFKYNDFKAIEIERSEYEERKRHKIVPNSD
jgi:hypothetical protein